MLCNTISEKLDRINEKNQLLYFKMLLCSILHKLGNPVFNSRTMYISTACGENRYEIAKKYGQHRTRSYAIKSKNTVRTYIVLDY